MPRWSQIAILSLFTAIVAIRIVAVFTADVNWDEFAMLHRAAGSVRSGVLAGGGRPGLGTLLLMPFADGCRNAVAALVQARLLWTAMVLGSVVVFGLLLRSVLPPSPGRWISVMTGVGLWTLAPAFLRHSVEVRTDQPGILLGLLGGLSLVASRRQIYWAPVAGALMGAGFLFTQKLLYVAGLVGVLAAAQLLGARDWQLGRTLARAGLVGAGFLVVVASYSALLSMFGSATAMLPVSSGLREFDYYRKIFGWNVYRPMLPTLFPQFAVIALLIAVTLHMIRRRHIDRGLLAAWAVMLVGLGVLLFHAGRFPYFYMVIGLFPAAVGAFVVAYVLEHTGVGVARAAMLAMLWVPLALGALRQAAVRTVDAQQIQRASLSFVERNFPSSARGFQSHGAFVCRTDPNHFPVRFRQHVLAQFGGVDGAERVRELIDEFRRRPVAFMMWPPEDYHDELGRFWATRYVHYYGAVHVAGRQIRGQPGATGEFEVIVPGEYVWRTTSQESGALEIEGRAVEPGATITLPVAGIYRIALPAGGEGMIVLALPEPPAPDPRPFYTGW